MNQTLTKEWLKRCILRSKQYTLEHIEELAEAIAEALEELGQEATLKAPGIMSAYDKRLMLGLEQIDNGYKTDGDIIVALDQFVRDVVKDQRSTLLATGTEPGFMSPDEKKLMVQAMIIYGIGDGDFLAGMKIFIRSTVHDMINDGEITL